MWMSKSTPLSTPVSAMSSNKTSLPSTASQTIQSFDHPPGRSTRDDAPHQLSDLQPQLLSRLRRRRAARARHQRAQQGRQQRPQIRHHARCGHQQLQRGAAAALHAVGQHGQQGGEEGAAEGGLQHLGGGGGGGGVAAQQPGGEHLDGTLARGAVGVRQAVDSALRGGWVGGWGVGMDAAQETGGRSEAADSCCMRPFKPQSADRLYTAAANPAATQLTCMPAR